jgi:hypothetical protein
LCPHQTLERKILAQMPEACPKKEAIPALLTVDTQGNVATAPQPQEHRPLSGHLCSHVFFMKLGH